MIPLLNPLRGTEIILKPHKLTLTGFEGVRCGLGKDTVTLDLRTIPEDRRLVALVGPNGSAKTTILDNLHPYRMMPSHCKTLSPGAFSYWDHISGHEAEKELEWEHVGHQYRSHFVFRSTGARKQGDYYLFQWSEHRRAWEPARLHDGTEIDGKAELYDRCINELLGPPESFFTSQFAAQHRKSISQYTAGDIKTLLASILKCQEFQLYASKASAVIKQLTFHHNDLQNQILKGQLADRELESIATKLSALSQREGQLVARHTELDSEMHRWNGKLAEMQAAHQAWCKDAEQATFLRQQIEIAQRTQTENETRALARFNEQFQSMKSDQQTLTAEQKRLTDVGAKLSATMTRYRALISREPLIDSASSALQLAQGELQTLDRAIDACRGKWAAAAPVRMKQESLVRRQAELTTLGATKANLIQEWQVAGALVDQVPCSKMEIRSQCKLMAHANAASQLASTGQGELTELRRAYKETTANLREVATELAVVDAVAQQLENLVDQRTKLVNAANELRDVAAERPLVNEAKGQLAELDLQASENHVQLEGITLKLAQLGTEIVSLAEAFDQENDAIKCAGAQQIAVLTERLSQLAHPVSKDQQSTIEKEINNTRKAIEENQVDQKNIAAERVELLVQAKAFERIKEQTSVLVKQSELLSDAIAKYRLLEKGFGNDGLVALSIDDAGPEISRLCNRLLADEYEGRFAVRIDTQRTTKAGGQRETFEIKVFDSHGGKEKLLDFTSGGEKVWINECLLRAIALFVGGNNHSKCETLFSDETDGALDPDRKQQFVKMKRSVLAYGGYSREYFISQTPAVWEQADHIIEMETL